MTTYCVPDSITPRPIKPGVATVETIEAIMADGPCAILPVAGDCLEGVDVVDGGWVAVDFTRRPAPPRYRSKGGDGSSDLCLCYATFPGAPGPMVMYKEYQGVWGPWQMVGTRYKSMWEAAPQLWHGGKAYLRRDCGLLRPGWAAPVAEEPRGVSQEAGNSANHPRRCGAVPGGESMITFPVTAETFIADQEKRAGRKFDDFQRELLGEYAELFNLEFDVGMKGEEPSNVLKDTAEFYARKGKLEELEKPVLKHFYACVQYWCREAWKQGAAKAERNGVRA